MSLSYKNLANTYRPHDWESVVGQEYTKTILRNALTSGRVGTAYIFHGTRGTGKTTSARILAEGINCLSLRDGNPCHECTNCIAFENNALLDVIEIDAASNTGVDNIRDLIDSARFQPNQGKYKIYIIDEVHMLSKGAFNALLKILEEPPPHVKFILATTEIEKVPETIRSRTQRFDFRRIAQEDIADQLEKICQSEGIQADRSALMLIARLAKGALRDAITLLEQNRVNDAITREHIMHTLSMVDEAILKNVIQRILSGDFGRMKDLLVKLSHTHIQVRIFVEELLFLLRDDLYSETDMRIWKEKVQIFDTLTEMYGKIKYTPDTFLLLEMTLLKLTAGGVNPSEQKVAPPRAPEQKPISEAPPEVQKPETFTETVSPEKKDFSFSQFVTRIRERKPALALDLKETGFRVEDTTLILISTSELRHGRLMTPEHRAIIQDTLREFVGSTWKYQTFLEIEGNTLKDAVDEVF